MKALFKPNLDVLDVYCWIGALLFFTVSALLLHGDLTQTLLGATGIVFLMLVISHSVEILLGVLRSHPKAGEISGYITNGPEALVMLVGLIHGKVLLAAGVPLGSNFANPILLIVAGLLARQLSRLFLQERFRTEILLIMTMLLAGSFYLVENDSQRWWWVGITFIASLFIYKFKGDESPEEEWVEPLPAWYLVPASLLLAGAGYFLDPVVAHTAENSRVPDGAIGFFVLSFITSWPEFRSTVCLLKINRHHSAIMNIVISNITNLWLASVGLACYLLFQK